MSGIALLMPRTSLCNGRLGLVIAFLLAAPWCLAHDLEEADHQEKGHGEVAMDGKAPGAFRHDGFYLRLNLAGLGFGSAQTEAEGTTERIYGLASVVDLGIGGAVTENLILHGDIFGPALVNPRFSSGGEAYETDKTTVSCMGLGGGITYYFMPVNFYLTAIVGLAKMQIEIENEQVGNTDVGFSLQLSLGKEWWVSENWGLGIGGSFALQAMKGTVAADSPVWKIFSGAVLFSVTYN